VQFPRNEGDAHDWERLRCKPAKRERLAVAAPQYL